MPSRIYFGSIPTAPAVPGPVELEIDARWSVGGYTSITIDARWEVGASTRSIDDALAGQPSGVVRLSYRYERRTIANVYQADVTGAIIGARIEADNGRDIFRTATFSIDPDGAAIDPLADHIAVIADILVDGSYTASLPCGLFALTVPKKTYRPGIETWQVGANDLGIHLMEATTTAPYTVAAAANYITGANAVKAILDAFSLRSALAQTTLTLPVAMTWPVGTPWLRVVNDLLGGANFYPLWFDASGVGRTRPVEEPNSRTATVTYTGDDFILTAPIAEESDTTRFANQVVGVVEDPNRGILRSVKTNADPDSPTSTVSLGRTITHVVRADRAADQTTLDLIVTNKLQSFGLYRRATLQTAPDPRRDAHEVYEITVEDLYDAELWIARSWSLDCRPGAPMQHAIERIEKVVAA